MKIDVFTALSASSFLILLLGIVLVVHWWHDRSRSWLGWLASAYFFIGIGNTLTIVSPTNPKAIALAGGAAVFFVGYALIWQAMRVFEHRKPVWWSLPVLGFGWPILMLLPGVATNVSLRVGIVSVPLAALLLLAGFEIWRGLNKEPLAAKRWLAIVLFVHAALAAIRIPLAALAAYPIGVAEAPNYVVAVFVGGLTVASILQAIFAISMTIERSERNQRTLAVTDPLTGLLNRRGLDARLNGFLPAGSALIVFDLDRFKLVNDGFGHSAGDKLISEFALICREELRQVDYGVRLGGEEFALIRARSDADEALAFAERIRQRFARTVVEIEGGALVGTASGGVFAATTGRTVPLASAIIAADMAMYQAKAEGRNRVLSSTQTNETDRQVAHPQVATA